MLHASTKESKLYYYKCGKRERDFTAQSKINSRVTWRCQIWYFRNKPQQDPFVTTVFECSRLGLCFNCTMKRLRATSSFMSTKRLSPVTWQDQMNRTSHSRQDPVECQWRWSPHRRSWSHRVIGFYTVSNDWQVIKSRIKYKIWNSKFNM